MEIDLFIRYFGFIAVALFLYKKILNIKDISKLQLVSTILFALIMGALLSHRVLFSPIIILLAVGMFVNIAAKAEKYLMVSVVIISVGISIGVYLISEFFITVIVNNFYLFAVMALNNLSQVEIENIRPLFVSINEAPPIINTSLELLQAIVLATNIIFIFLLSKIKRLKSGFVFLENKKAMSIGINISALVIVISSVFAGFAFLMRNYSPYEMGEMFSNNPIYSLLTISFFIVIAICLAGMHLWWRHSTTMQYKRRVRERNNEEYLAEIAALTECNEFLSKAIHRDNKLIPAMYNALINFLKEYDQELTPESKSKGLNLLAELSEIMQERNDMLLMIQKNYKAHTGIERVDNILNYMISISAEKEIQFDIAISGTIENIVEGIISKQSLATLLSDLIENAIIAVTQSDYKKISLSMGEVKNAFEITIQDSGIPFEAETLANLGIRKSTTRTETGGSGIGYMTIFEILSECKASITIQNTSAKEIKIRFDGNALRNCPKIT
ncbi:MAG: ATP-binding protein [Defluviitaleaceae bacterium]|nr:ATP-binding protein [Defluviitaleaceae bacterium]